MSQHSSLLNSIFQESDDVPTRSSLFDATTTSELNEKLAKRQRTATTTRASSNTSAFNDTKDEPKSRKDILQYRMKCFQNPLTKLLTVRHDTKEPLEAFCEDIAGLVQTYGVAVAEQVIDLETIDKLQDLSKQAFAKVDSALRHRNLTWNEDINNHQTIRFRQVVVRCKGRMDVLFDDSSYISFWENHPIVKGVIDTLLYGGESRETCPKLVYAGWIFSAPGSADQPFHQDGIPLFPKLSEQLPAYAINVFIPLQDTTIEMGPTEFKPSSHSIPPTESPDAMGTSVCPLPRRGDMLLYDYRVCHRGTANFEWDVTRSVLYLMFARPWFQEHVNFGTESLWG